MAKTTLAETHGPSASWDGDRLILVPQDWASFTGLKPSLNTSPDALLAAHLLYTTEFLTEQKHVRDHENRKVSVLPSGHNLMGIGGTEYKRKNLTVFIYEPYSVPPMELNAL